MERSGTAMQHVLDTHSFGIHQYLRARFVCIRRIKLFVKGVLLQLLD